MLVIANGAFKSGSSWLLEILKQIRDFDEIPEQYRSSLYRQAWLDHKKALAFLESGYYRERDFISKGHFFGHRYRKLFLSYKDVYVFDITRDMKDSIASHYYHFKRVYGVDWDFPTFYWRVGRFKAYQIKLYHGTWYRSAPTVYVSSYERLKNDFEEEVHRIGRFIGVELEEGRIREIKEITSIESMRQARGQDKLREDQRFFRKGVVGDWRNHFNERMLRDVERIESRGLNPLDWSIYHLLFSLRPSLNFHFRARIKSLFRARV